jgi:hypothetical protein
MLLPALLLSPTATLRRARGPLAAVASACLAVLLGGCDPSGEKAFLARRGENPCLERIQACPGETASCVLDDYSYTVADFPGSFRFLVEANSEDEIEVMLYLTDQRDAGISTYIYWNEPGCIDTYIFDSAGRNLFEEADDHVIREKRKVYDGGEHLIEIDSDMQAHTDIAIHVIEPGS